MSDRFTDRVNALNQVIIQLLALRASTTSGDIRRNAATQICLISEACIQIAKGYEINRPIEVPKELEADESDICSSLHGETKAPKANVAGIA